MSHYNTDNSKTRVWIIDDNAGDQLLIQEMLIDLNFKAKHIRAFDSVSGVLEELKNDSPDVLLLDLFLPESRGVETFQLLSAVQLHFPVIVLSGLADSATALETVKLGAQDYLIKDEMTAEIIDKMILYSLERFSNLLEIKRSEQKYRLLFKSIPTAVLMLSDKYRILEANAAAEALFGPDLLRKCTEYSDLFSNVTARSTAMQGVERDQNVRFRLELDDGTHKFVEQSSAANGSGSEMRFLVSLVDRTQVVLTESNRNKIIHETLDDERNRFSKELHDGLAQYLVVLNMHLQMLKGFNDKVDEGLESCIETLSTSLKMVRSISYNLSPPDLDKGLIPALQSLFKRLQNLNTVEFRLRLQDDLEEFDLSQVDEYSLFRLIQEFTNNSLKYAECSEIRCSMEVHQNRLIIGLSDNGKGFDSENVLKGLGLKNMSERAFAANFTFNFYSEPGKGTSVQLISEFDITD